MLKIFRKAFLRLRRDEGGNVFILFGACALPLLLVMGGAVDFARYTRYKSELSHAVDSAALALARQHPDYTEAQATTFVTNYVNSFSVGDTQFTMQNFDVDKIANGFRVSVNGTMTTLFLPLTRFTKTGAQPISGLTMNIVAEVVNASNRVEVALVMDNTGSMNCGASLDMTCVADWSSPGTDSRIVAVKAAAKTLVDTLMPDDLVDKDLVKIAIVPFEGQVNVASAGFNVTTPPTWIEWSDVGNATWEGVNFGLANTTTHASCSTASSTCKRMGHKYLFGRLTAKFPTVKWAGCVEMRAGTYELSDAAPNATIADSLFVPFFHPDEPDSLSSPGITSSVASRYNNDSNGSTSGGTQYYYANDYMKDLAAYTPANAQKNFTKYTSGSAAFWGSGSTSRMDVEGLLTPYEFGPNKGCPRPIYPLANANNKIAIKAQIDAMIAYWSTGTFLPAGLVWGWHVLSPGIPYTEGTKPGDEYYDKTVKAIVFFTDGENDISDDSALNPPGNPNKSRYSGYNYVNTTDSTGSYRLASTTSAAIDALDTKTATLCASVKTNSTANDATDDIRLYVVTFGTISSATSTLMTNCATLDSSGSRLYYHAPSTSDLEDIFKRIGEDLSEIHLSM